MMYGKESILEEIVSKCKECGLEPEAFLKEKILELEERKRVLVTPCFKWFKANYTKYNDFASKVLQRALYDEEKYGGGALIKIVERRFNIQKVMAVNDEIKKRLLKESNNRCKICGEILDLKKMRVDHKFPIAEGGSPDVLNLQAVCFSCNSGKSDYFEDTAQAAARPWFERRKCLVEGKIDITNKKRFCVLNRDGSKCKKCEKNSSEVKLIVTMRVSEDEGGQAVYDNLITVCEGCLEKQ